MSELDHPLVERSTDAQPVAKVPKSGSVRKRGNNAGQHWGKPPTSEQAVDPSIYWAKQQAADDAFQQAMIGAGHASRVETKPSTEKPRTICPTPAIRSTGYGNP